MPSPEPPCQFTSLVARDSALIAALAMACLVAGGRSVAGQGVGRKDPEIDRVDFRGLRSVPESQARLVITSKASYCRLPPLAPVCRFVRSAFFVRHHVLEPGELERDVVNLRGLLWQRGFREATVDTIVRPSRHGVAITFDINEGPPTLLDTLVIERSSDLLTPDAVRRAVPLRVGAPLNLAALDTALAGVRNALWDQGYADAAVAPEVSVNDETHRASVRIVVAPGRRAQVATITIEGNARLSDGALREALTFEPGDLFRRRDLLESQRFLYQSFGLVSAAIVTPPRPDPNADSLKHVEVRVQENAARQFGIEGGLNTTDFFQIGGRVGLFALRGGRWQLVLRGATGNLLARQLDGAGPFSDVTRDGDESNAFTRPTWQGSTELTRLWAGSPRNRFTLGAFGHRRSEPSVFVDRGIGGFASFTREVVDRAPVTLGYRMERAAVDAGDVYFCQSFGLCDASTIGALRDPRRLASVTLNAWLDRSDSPVNPSAGHTLRLELDDASRATGSEYRHFRVSGEATAYHAFGSWVLAARARGGWAHAQSESVLHPRALFYAGGAESVRGYGENQLGPRVLTVRRDALLAGGCTDASVADGSCDPGEVPSRAFSARPVGATSLVEGTLELRVPLAGRIGGVFFADGAALGPGAGSVAMKRAAAVTPGFGLRYETNVGMLRLDAGWRGANAERLPVVVETRAPNGDVQVLRLGTEKRWDPLDDVTGLRRTLRQFTLHFALGHAF